MSNPIASDEQIKQWSKDISRAEITMLRKQLATVTSELAKLRDEIASGEPVAEFEGHGVGGGKLTRTPDLEADEALLAATQAAIEAQTVECYWCCGEGGYHYEQPNSMSYGVEECQRCNGRGRVPK